MGKGAQGARGRQKMKASAGRYGLVWWLQVLLPFLLSLFPGALSDQIRYSIPEELAKNSVVGNLAKDLGLSVRDLPARKLRVSAEREYFTVNPESGDLLVGDKIDREQICGKQPLCVLDFDTVAENPLNIFHISDVNDNAPLFQQTCYMVHVAENNPPGASIAQISASDPDLGPNGQVSYSIVASDLEPREILSYVSVSAQSGVVFAQRAFDHEQLRAFELTLQATDQGSPALSANVSLRVLVGDLNDNVPLVLYPALGPDGSALFDMVPRAAEPGYLVTKVVAVDADSGHNAWLSYHVLQASEPGLFSLGLRTGEVRTARALGERDAARQRLLVAVRDGGQPPLSATATLHLIFADSLQEVLPDLSGSPEPSDPQTELQFYLVVALALISVLFLFAVILAISLRLRRSSSSDAWGCFQSSQCSKPGPGVLPNYSEGTLPFSYNLCVASQSAKTEFNFLNVTPELVPSQDLLCDNASWEQNTNHADAGVPFASDTILKQAPPNTDWRFSQAQRPGTSGSQNGDDTGTWPNNQFDTEMLQAMILASASEAADGSSTLGGGAGTMGLSARYGPQFTLQHVPDYRQNVYIPGSNATLTNAAGKRDGKAPAGGNGNKKKSGKKEKK
ncbi:protocadherin gamma-B2 isoform X29 [Macaca mulatta]